MNKILYDGFWIGVCWPFGVPGAVLLLFIFILLVSTALLPLLLLLFVFTLAFVGVLLLVVDALLLFSVRISTLKRTFREMNFSGERYSQRKRLGLFMLCIKS